jgi:phosphohistidine phosphatase
MRDAGVDTSTMLLYLVRHGEAEPGSLETSDAMRRLTAHGQRQCQWLGEQIIASDELVPPALLMASGLKRASQTAQIIHQIVGGELRREQALELGWPIDDVLSTVVDEMLAGRKGPIMLVGHNPQMEGLIESLAPGAARPMRTGTAMLLDVDGDGALRGSGKVVGSLRLD